MIRQIKYAWNDFRKNMGFYLLFGIEMAVMTFFICASIGSMLRYYDDTILYKQYLDQEVYYFHDKTTDSQLNAIFKSENKLVPEFRDIFLEMLHDEEVICYIYFSYGVSEDFYNLHYKYFSAEKHFTSSDFDDAHDYSSCIVSSDLKEEAEVNPEYDNGIFKSVIVGIMDEDAGYGYQSIGNVYKYSDKTIYAINDYFLESIISIDTFDEMLGNLKIACSEEKAQYYYDLLKDTGSFVLELRPYREYYDFVAQLHLEGAKVNALLALFIMVIVMISLFCQLLVIIDRQMIEYAIHLYFGASLKDIIYRFILQLLPSYLFSFLPIGIYINAFGLRILFWLILVMAVLFSIVIGLLIYKLKKQNMLEIIRSY